jgi:hypothetical protein
VGRALARAAVGDIWSDEYPVADGLFTEFVASPDDVAFAEIATSHRGPRGRQPWRIKMKESNLKE